MYVCVCVVWSGWHFKMFSPFVDVLKRNFCSSALRERKLRMVFESLGSSVNDTNCVVDAIRKWHQWLSFNLSVYSPGSRLKPYIFNCPISSLKRVNKRQSFDRISCFKLNLNMHISSLSLVFSFSIFSAQNKINNIKILIWINNQSICLHCVRSCVLPSTLQTK